MGGLPIHFYASLFPILIDLAAIDAWGVAAIFAITIMSVVSVKISYAFFDSRVASIAIRQKHTDACQKTVEILMAGAGSYLAFKT